MREDSGDFGDVLVDVSELSLRDLGQIDGSSLALAVTQVLSSGSQVAAFSSAL